MATTTDQQMALANDAKFQRRLQALFLAEAQTVVIEAPATPNHAQRRALAQSTLTDSATTARQFAAAMATSTNIVSSNITYDFVQLAVVTDATDAAIASEISTLWSGFAGV